jgi:uncharacterized protein YndB with AHSA1/START domain
MTTVTHPETTIEVPTDLPHVIITREFDHPVEKVFRAFVEPNLYARWIGPRRLRTEIQRFDAVTGGAWRFSQAGDDGTTHEFYGSFHEVRPNERIVQTFCYLPWPDSVALETAVFEDLGDGRTRLVSTSQAPDLESRDGFVASGMEEGVREGYEKLDELLAALD